MRDEGGEEPDDRVSQKIFPAEHGTPRLHQGAQNYVEEQLFRGVGDLNLRRSGSNELGNSIRLTNPLVCEFRNHPDDPRLRADRRAQRGEPHCVKKQNAER